MNVDRAHIISTSQEAAFHEAGHVLFMVHFGHQVLSVEINWNEDESRWDGQTERDTQQSNHKMNMLNPDYDFLVSEALIAFSGCLVQALFLARQQHPGAKFSANQSWDDLHSWMKNTDTQSRAPFDLRFESSVGNITVPADPRSFGGMDQTVFLQLMGRLVFPKQKAFLLHRFRETLTKLIEFVNSDAFWDRAVAIADSLTGRVAQLEQVPYSARIDNPIG